MKTLERISLILAGGIAALFMLLYLIRPGFLEDFEAQTYDFRFRTRGPVKHSPGIAIIAIDEQSIAELGRFPWSREHYAALIDVLARAGARALLMDAFFPEPQSPQADGAFARSMSNAGFVTLAAGFHFLPDGNIERVTRSIPMLTGAARRTAHINLAMDEDGVNRWAMPFINYRGMQYPSLGLAGAMEAMGVDDFRVLKGRMEVGERTVPLSADGIMLINYPGPPGTYETFPFVDVIKGRVEPKRLGGKVLFVGATTALGVYDMRMTPFYYNTPGVAINTSIADTIIQGAFITRGARELVVDLVAILTLSLIVCYITARLGHMVALPSAFGLLFAHTGFVYYMFLRGSWVSFVYPVLAVILSYSVTAYLRFMLLDKKQKEMRSMFSSYVSRKVVDQLVQHPEAARIGGDTKEITILFADIRGYTSYSESHEPEQVVGTLNEYLAAMSKVIIWCGGTVDKFLGDGIMAYWGAPLPQPNHPELAASCALGMLERLRGLKEKWASEGTEPFSIRIGLNSGRAVAGNIGARSLKMEYTVIGDTVNLGSRVEGTAKLYGVPIIATEATYLLTREKFLYRELDKVRLLGKAVPIRIYQLIKRAGGEEDGPLIERIRKFEEGLGLFREMKWEEALAVFGQLHDEEPEDVPSGLFVERCRSFMESPPESGWDGVYERSSK